VQLQRAVPQPNWLHVRFAPDRAHSGIEHSRRVAVESVSSRALNVVWTSHALVRHAPACNRVLHELRRASSRRPWANQHLNELNVTMHSS